MAKKRTASDAAAALAADASFIFRGAVVRTNASNVPGVKSSPRTAIVRVDDVIAAPPSLASTAGREVTVALDPASRSIRAGEEAVFHAGGVSFGDEIALSATIAEPALGRARGGLGAARAAAAPLAAAGVVDPVQAHRDLLLKRSLDQADVVVAGTVTQVREAPETVAAGAPRTLVRSGLSRGGRPAAGSPASPVQRISEHDAIWHEALVNVESVEKGATTQKQVVVRFPGSNDVRWRYHPKLRVGQQGVFLLADQGGAPPTRGVAAGRATLAGRAARPMTTIAVPMAQSAGLQAIGETQPITGIERVRQLLNQPTAAPAAVAAPARRSKSTTAKARSGRSRARTRSSSSTRKRKASTSGKRRK